MISESSVSIICLSFNQAQYIEESLDSVKSQTYSNYELIICDDSSNDNSVAIIENWINRNRDLNVRFIAHLENKGICKSLNECLSFCSGKYIQILALDDLLPSWKLDRHVKILDSSKDNFALVFSDALLIDENSQYYQNRFIAYHKPYLSITSGNFFNDLLDCNFIPAMTVLLKKSILDEVGLYDEDLSFEDYDMWLKVSEKYDFIFDDIPSASYRLHSNNTHRKMKSRLVFDTFKIFLKYSGNQGVKEKLKKDLEYMYLNNGLIGQEQLYFNKYKPDNILDRMIYLNMSKFWYKSIREILKLKNS